MAVSDQDVGDSSLPATKHQYVKQLLTEEMEKYVGKPINIDHIVSYLDTPRHDLHTIQQLMSFRIILVFESV